MDCSHFVTGNTHSTHYPTSLGTVNIDYNDATGLSGDISRYQSLNYGQGINMILATDSNQVTAKLTSNIDTLNVNGAGVGYDGTVRAVLNRVVQK